MSGDALARAVESAISFLTEHATIKSSTVIEVTRGKLEGATNYWEFFTIPVMERLLGYSGSLLWMHFVQSQPDLADLGAEAFPWGDFALHTALDFLRSVHDLSFDDLVFTHSMRDEESNAESGSGEEEEEEG